MPGLFRQRGVVNKKIPFQGSRIRLFPPFMMEITYNLAGLGDFWGFW